MFPVLYAYIQFRSMISQGNILHDLVWQLQWAYNVQCRHNFQERIQINENIYIIQNIDNEFMNWGFIIISITQVVAYNYSMPCHVPSNYYTVYIILNYVSLEFYLVPLSFKPTSVFDSSLMQYITFQTCCLFLFPIFLST